MWPYLVIAVLYALTVLACGLYVYRRFRGRGAGCGCGLGADCPALHAHCNYCEPTTWPERLHHG